MSSLIVEVCKIDKIKKHKNADKLEVCVIKGWENITKIGQFKEGDKVVFIPPDSSIPRYLAKEWNVENYLSGKPDSPFLRVRSVKLRGEMSYGLVIPSEKPQWEVGKDVAEFYGIKKYEPPLRGTIGDAAPEDFYFTKLSDIENIRNKPEIFQEGQMVVATEKLDGTACSIGVSPIVLDRDSDMAYIDQELYPYFDMEDESFDYTQFSIWKARSHRVNRKRPDSIEEIKKNTYWFPYANENIYNLVEHLFYDKKYSWIQLWGEVLGPGISGGSKLLHYGIQNEFRFFAYALVLNGVKLSFSDFYGYCTNFSVQTVPMVEIFNYDFDYAVELSKGESILANQNGAKHIREGIVLCSYGDKDGDIAKFINPDYLILKEDGKIEDFTDA